MNPNPASHVRPVPMLRQPTPGPACEPPRLPSWWLGSSEEFALVHDARREIHRHDRIMARKALALMTLSVLATVLIYSVDAIGAAASQGGAGLFSVSVLLLILTGIWILDRRLAQQYRDARLQAFVWNELVAAVRQGCVDLSRLEPSRPGETEVEGLLRNELDVVAQYLASQENLELHLPLFNDSITLTKA